MTLKEAKQTGKPFRRPKGIDGSFSWRDNWVWWKIGDALHCGMLTDYPGNGRVCHPDPRAFVVDDWYVIHDQSVALKPSPGMVCECGNKQNGPGQGHGTWCDLYRREF